MIWYLIIFATVMAISNMAKENRVICADNQKVNSVNISILAFVAIVILLILFEGLRSDMVGTDTGGYCRGFSNRLGRWWTLNYSNPKNLIQEPGFGLVNLFASLFGDNYLYLLVTCACCCVFPALISIRNSSVDFSASLVVYITFGCYLFGFAGIRQGIAMSIFLFSFPYLFSKDFKRFLIVVLVAALFHKSVLLALPIYFICTLKYSLKSIIILVIFSFVFSGVLSSLIVFSSSVDERYAYYMEETEAGSGVLLMLSCVFVTLFFMIQRKHISPNRLRVYDRSLLMMIVACSIYIVVTLSGSNTEINRFAQYFQLGAIYLFAELAVACKRKGLTLPIIILNVFFAAYYIGYVSKIGGIAKYQLNPLLF